MVSLTPKELPDLRRHLAESMTGDYDPAIIAAALHGEDAGRQDVEPMDVAMAAIDARIPQEADLYFVTMDMTSLLTQARGGIGEAGFMPFDLPGPVGMAYLDGDIPCEQQGHRWNERVIVLWHVDLDVWEREALFWYPDEISVLGGLGIFRGFCGTGMSRSDTATPLLKSALIVWIVVGEARGIIGPRERSCSGRCVT